MPYSSKTDQTEEKTSKEQINRIHAKESNKPSKFGATERKGTKRTEKRNKVSKKLSKYDDVISACFSELTTPKEPIKSLESTMQTADSLSEIANRLKVLSLENRQNTVNTKSENLKFCDLPISQASNSILPLCLENFAFEPNLAESEMLYHKLASRISELPEIRTKIAMIIAHIQDIEPRGKFFFVNDKWQMKELTQDETQTVQGVKAQLAQLYTLLEEAKLDHKIPEQLMDIGEKQLLKEVIANVRGGKETKEEDSARLLGTINAITEKPDISLAKLVEETNKDAELSALRQAILDGNLEQISTHYRHKKNQLSVEYGLVFLDSMVIIPDRMQEWILQIAHGNHESAEKRERYANVFIGKTRIETLQTKQTTA